MSTDRSRRWALPAALLGLPFLMILAGNEPLLADPQNAREHLQRGIEEMQRGSPENGLREIQKAIEEEPQYAVAHFYAGMAMAQMQRFAEAWDYFVAAADLSPGYGEAHMRACMVAFHQGKFDQSWEQAILAAEAGMNMEQAFAELQAKAQPPPDWRERLSAPRVAIGGMDISALTGQESSVWAGEQATRGAEDMRADERGTAPVNPTEGLPGQLTPPPTAGFPLPIGQTGAGLAGEVQAELNEVQRRFGAELARSLGFSVVPRLELARYILVLKVDDVGGSEPRPLKGFVKLFDYDTAQEIYSRPLDLRNISSVSDLRNDVARYVGYMEEWRRQQERE